LDIQSNTLLNIEQLISYDFDNLYRICFELENHNNRLNMNIKEKDILLYLREKKLFRILED